MGVEAVHGNLRPGALGPWQVFQARGDFRGLGPYRCWGFHVVWTRGVWGAGEPGFYLLGNYSGAAGGLGVKVGWHVACALPWRVVLSLGGGWSRFPPPTQFQPRWLPDSISALGTGDLCPYVRAQGPQAWGGRSRPRVL